MDSLIRQYAVEGNTNGDPNGEFFMTKDGMNAVAGEIVQTHLGF